MSNLTVIEYQSQRVLTTQQLADAYETESNNIVKNFSRNEDRFIKDRDYHLLEGEELKSFKGNMTNSHFAPNLNKLYLWTERGANRHSKILDTDKAWQQFDLLEETYFQVKQQIQPQQLSKLEILELAIAAEKKVLELQATITEQKPAVVFAQSVECSKDTVLIKGLSTILKQNGIDIGQNRLFEWMRNNGYLSRRPGKTYNAPTQKSLDLKVMEEKTTTINKPDREPIISNTPLITGKGQLYFINKFLNKDDREAM